MAQFAIQEAITSERPSGFQTTLSEAAKLRKLSNANVANLGDTVQEYQSYKLTEQDAIRSVVSSVADAFETPQATLQLPGTTVESQNGHILQFASAYKADNDTPSGTIKPASLAKTDDIVFTFANPEVYNQIAGTTISNFVQGNQSGGTTMNLVGDQGIDSANNTQGSPLSLAADEWMFFTGDYIQLASGKGVTTKTQITSVDGENYGPADGMLSNRLSGAHVMTSEGTFAQSTIDIDVKVYQDGPSELVPVAFYMGPGTKNPALV